MRINSSSLDQSNHFHFDTENVYRFVGENKNPSTRDSSLLNDLLNEEECEPIQKNISPPLMPKPKAKLESKK
jgi:hypothetical protein